MSIKDFGIRREISMFEACHSEFNKTREEGMASVLNRADDRASFDEWRPDTITERLTFEAERINRVRKQYTDDIARSLIDMIVFINLAAIVTAATLVFNPSGTLLIISGIFLGISFVRIASDIIIIGSLERYRRCIACWYYSLGEAEAIKSEVLDWEPPLFIDNGEDL